MIIRTETHPDVADVDKFIGEIRQLLPEHWRELAENRDEFGLDVDWGLYVGVYRSGMLHITTAREDGGELLGYHVVMVRRHAHSKRMVAVDAVSFVRPSPGRIWVLLAMIRHTIDDLKARGVRSFWFRVKLKRNYGPLLERLGFAPCEMSYIMTLPEGGPS